MTKKDIRAMGALDYTRLLRKILFNTDQTCMFKKDKKNFTRKRKLTFPNIILIILQKSVRSLQNTLNEFFDKLDNSLTHVSASAFSQARQKISHKIFIMLNNEVILKRFYKEPEYYKRYKGMRVLGVDGSRIVLPDSPEVESEFGTITNKNQCGVSGHYSVSTVSVLYDLLNNIAVDSKIAPVKSHERELTVDHLESCMKNDLIIGDRGYPSYELACKITQKGLNFLFRCSSRFFKEAQTILLESGMESKVVTLKKPYYCKGKEFPVKIKVRFVKVILDNGEVEILATSLLNKDRHPVKDFKELYWKRWGIETFYNIIKNRLSLENFTGKTVEAVKQDFYSTIFISNSERIFSADAQEILEKRSSKNMHKQKVNKSVSFNVIKNNLIWFLYIEDDLDEKELIEKITKSLLQTPVAIRENRNFTRKSNKRKSANYQKYRKKSVF